MNTSPYRSALHPLIARYVTLHQSLGKGFDQERRILDSLDRWLGETPQGDLTAETFNHWCKSKLHLSLGVRRRYMRIVHNFCLYRRRTEPGCFVPDPRLFPAAHQSLQPHIFSEQQIARLLCEAERLEPLSHSPLRGAVYRLAIVLLYTTGMRRGELVRLTVGDYAPDDRTLLVRRSKFHKSRYLPLSHDAVRELNAHLQLRRDHHLPLSPDTPLIWNRCRNGKAYSGGGLGQGLRLLFRSAGIRTPDGRLPRTHDVRHTFAVHALMRWYRNGADVGAKLPLLATYMGHVSIVSTERYLHFVQELASTSSDRFAAHYEALITPTDEIPGAGR